MKLKFDHKLAIAILVVVAAFAGIVWVIFSGPLEINDSDRALYRCIFLCESARSQGIELEHGPCISSGTDAWEMGDWVCDIAHNPRQEIDTLPQNQCPEYGVTANHFVELTSDCEPIWMF